jgi:hypothetical protein
MSKFLRIVYCSRNRVTGSRADVEVQIRNILATARTHNKAMGLSGAMTFNDNYFAQVLEGDAARLAPLLGRIRRDPRHSDIKILEQTETAQRLFPHWSMAYVDTPDDNGRHPLAHFAFEAALITGAEPEAEQLLDSMRRVTRDRP